MKTSYFTFGQSHTHAVGGFTYDKDIVVKITANDPREVMFEYFGTQWGFEYDECPDLKFFPSGVMDISRQSL
jgi:hypothetical protein